MARATLTPSALAANSSIADPAGTANVVANGLSIPGNSRYNPSLFLRVSNASGGSGTVTVKAGTQPSAISSGQGDLVVTVATGAAAWVGPFDSSRFQQSDGSISVDTSVVMTVTAFTVDGRRV